jgi:hypothetical protein
MAHLGLPETMIQPLAILELSCALIYWIPMTSVIGGILLAGYMGGTICVHWRVGDDFYTHIALGVAVWIGLWLRDARLWSLIPIRTSAS